MWWGQKKKNFPDDSDMQLKMRTTMLGRSSVPDSVLGEGKIADITHGATWRGFTGPQVSLLMARRVSPYEPTVVSSELQHCLQKALLKYIYAIYVTYTCICAVTCCHFSCVWLCDSMDCSLLGSSVHGISQTRILGWVAISFSRGSSWCRDRTCVSYVSCVVCIYILSRSLSLSGFSLLRERENVCTLKE